MYDKEHLRGITQDTVLPSIVIETKAQRAGVRTRVYFDLSNDSEVFLIFMTQLCVFIKLYAKMYHCTLMPRREYMNRDTSNPQFSFSLCPIDSKIMIVHI